MPTVLRLFEDLLAAGETAGLTGAAARALYVVAGSMMLDGEQVTADDGRVTTGAATITAGDGGLCLWRWQVASADQPPQPIATHGSLRLEAAIDLSAMTDGHLLRLDSVAFPPGGCALLHTHQGPGIRCLREGTIRIDSEGHSTAYGPGTPWFEAGPEPVFAAADSDIATRFIRAMVLPRALLATSSIRYVNAEDRDKPKSQTYRVFAEQVFARQPNQS